MNSEDIRSNLILRASRYAKSAGTSLSAIGTASVNDSKFLKRVESGEGFNINTYQKVVDWLADAERKLSPPKPSRRKASSQVAA